MRSPRRVERGPPCWQPAQRVLSSSRVTRSEKSAVWPFARARCAPGPASDGFRQGRPPAGSRSAFLVTPRFRKSLGCSRLARTANIVAAAWRDDLEYVAHQNFCKRALEMDGLGAPSLSSMSASSAFGARTTTGMFGLSSRAVSIMALTSVLSDAATTSMPAPRYAPGSGRQVGGVSRDGGDVSHAQLLDPLAILLGNDVGDSRADSAAQYGGRRGRSPRAPPAPTGSFGRCSSAARRADRRCAPGAGRGASGRESTRGPAAAARDQRVRAIESSAAATIRLCPCSGSSPSDTPRAARMKENSPICARLAPTVSAVLRG